LILWVIGLGDCKENGMNMIGNIVIFGYGFFVIGFGIGVGLVFVVYINGVVC